MPGSSGARSGATLALADGVKGDHGGHQRKIQRIPMAFSWPGLKPQRRKQRARSVDVLPTVLRLMGIERMPGHPLDGRAYKLRRQRKADRHGGHGGEEFLPEGQALPSVPRLA